MVEPVVGVHGLRTFRISRDLHLVPAALRVTDWDYGSCIAQCRSVYAATPSGPVHNAPDPDCSCGVYAARTLGFLQRQYSTARDVVAVVALEGRTIEGQYGWRSQAARVVALYLRPGLLTDAETALLMGHLPAGTLLFMDVRDMIAHYPQLADDETGPVIRTRLTAWRDSPLISLLLPLVLLGCIVNVPPAFRGLYAVAMTPGTPYLAGAAVIGLGGYAVAFASRPEWRIRLTAAPVIAVITLVLYVLWTLTLIRQLVVGASAAGHVITLVLALWTVGMILLVAKRPHAAAVAWNPLRTRAKTRVRWATTDPTRTRRPHHG